LPEVRQELAEYFTSVHRADEVVGAVLEELEKAGMKENTLVVFMSDHGMALPFAKTNCYHDSTRTPWIVRWPGVVKAGSEDMEHFVSGIDVTPTFLEAAGLPPLKGADGSSIVTLLKGGTERGRKRVFTMINRTAGRKAYPMRAVQDEQFLYIWNGWADGETKFRNESQSGRTMKAMQKAAEEDPAVAARVKDFLYRSTEELYDLQKDPACLTNLLAKKGGVGESRRSAMTKSLWHWMKRTGDPERKTFEGQVELALD
jgi:N-sulfoglucosamine sulfohydrolase